MDLREVGFQMYGLPPFTTVGMVLQLLEQYGHVTAVVIDNALQENSIVCVGTGWARIIGSPQQVQDMFRLVHKSCVFPGYPPIQLVPM